MGLKCLYCGCEGLVKQGDIYVCPVCKLDSSPEELNKKLTNSSITSSFAPGSSDEAKFKTLIETARKSAESKNYKDAQKYYEDANFLKYNDYESFFYSTYYQEIQFGFYSISNIVNNIGNALENAFGLIEINESDEFKSLYRQKIAVSSLQLIRKTYSMILGQYLKTGWDDKGYQKHVTFCAKLLLKCATLLESYDDPYSTSVYKMIMDRSIDPIHLTSMRGFLSKDEVEQIKLKIKMADPTYTGPESLMKELKNEIKNYVAGLFKKS